MRYMRENRMWEIIDFVDSYYSEHGVTPSVRAFDGEKERDMKNE